MKLRSRLAISRTASFTVVAKAGATPQWSRASLSALLLDYSLETTRPCGIDFSPGLCREPGKVSGSHRRRSLPAFRSMVMGLCSKAFMTSYLAQFARLSHANFTTYVARKTGRQL